MMSVPTIAKLMIGVLVGMVVAVPVITALFAVDGPFDQLSDLPTTGALATNSYSGILTAIIALIPLALIGGAGYYFWDIYSHKRQEYKAARSVRSRRQVVRRRDAEIRRRYANDPARAQFLINTLAQNRANLARVQSRRYRR